LQALPYTFVLERFETLLSETQDGVMWYKRKNCSTKYITTCMAGRRLDCLIKTLFTVLSLSKTLSTLFF